MIEGEIDLLEKRKSLIQDQQAEIDKQIDALDDYYKQLIENIKSYYESLIKPIEDYKAQFSDLLDIEESAKFVEQLESLGYSVNDILSLNASTLENFKSNYLGILHDLYDDNTQMLDAIRQVSGLESEFVGYLSMSQPYIDSLARLDLSNTQNAIDSANSGIHSFGDGALIATTNITNMADTVTNLLEGSKKKVGVISSFETMASILSESNAQINAISSGVDALDGKTATIYINIETHGDTSLLGKANVSGTAIVGGTSHAQGTAKVSGDWAVQSDEKNALMGEVGYEIIVRDGKFFTVGDNGAEMFSLKKGDIVFNHEQSEQLLKNGHISGRGKAYADGTVGDPFASGKLRPIQEGDRAFDLQQKFNSYLENIGSDVNSLLSHVNAIQKDMEQMVKSVSNINNISNSNNRTQSVVIGDIHITCPGVTSQEVMKQVGEGLNKNFSGLALAALQQSKI